MKAAFFGRIVRLQECRRVVLVASIAVLAATSAGCTKDRPPPVRAADASDRAPREPVVESPKRIEASSPYRARLSHGSELYLPTWFSARHGTYDLIVHFHGVGKLQEKNLDRSRIDAAVVSVNRAGLGTDQYAKAFRDPDSLPKLLAETQEEIDKSGRARGAKLGRIALSAWSAGFVSIAKIMSEPANAEKVDAVVLADGFFTSFTDVKKRTINTPALERFVKLVESASKNEKLFAITHSSIPTVGYPSVEETVAKLLEMTSCEKTVSTAVGPRDMRERYFVDRGSFHVRGYEGVTAADHVQQITAMGETLYPYLKARWDRPDAAVR